MLHFLLNIVNFGCFDYFFAFFCSKCIKSVAIDAKRRFASVLKTVYIGSARLIYFIIHVLQRGWT